MYLSDPELVQLAESISSRFRRSDFEQLLVTARLYSLVDLSDPQGEYAPILIKREFVLAILEDLRGRGRLERLFRALDGDDFTPDSSWSAEAALAASGNIEPTERPRPKTIGDTSRHHHLLSRLRWPSIDWKLVIAFLGFLVAVIALLYGNNLCHQSSSPSWAVGILRVVCPPPVNPTPGAVPSQIGLAATATMSPPQGIKVGVIQIPDYIYTELVPRLASMGFDAQWIAHTSDYSQYRDFDIIYLPAGWGYQSAVLHDRQTSFTSLLEQGGGIFIERPNAIEPFVAYFLPGKISFAPEVFDPLEYPSKILNHHAIVDGLDPADLPEVGNLIEDPDDQYEILAVSARSEYPTLLISEPLSGRVVITSSTLATAEGIRHPLSEELVRRSLLWLARGSIGP
jgi:hypothetical protein